MFPVSALQVIIDHIKTLPAGEKRTELSDAAEALILASKEKKKEDVDMIAMDKIWARIKG